MFNSRLISLDRITIYTAQFLDPYMLMHQWNDLWCIENRNSYPHGTRNIIQSQFLNFAFDYDAIDQHNTIYDTSFNMMNHSFFLTSILWFKNWYNIKGLFPDFSIIFLWHQYVDILDIPSSMPDMSELSWNVNEII